ncbi:hypothetical protein A8709_10960 [Paenibacillus pectinilyticus]|uniref:Uncharacterized protein n=1 Tax=Paenibacillus pectinilyticus TaxID=512399 RepID=A0A1C1A2C9_9BACL|nr:hypothetical protein [Paenibacillus pectinilyticus]OCT14695.1 hypothetical protein A8709_10960 [Paenibacillus pectinilyticus]
MARVFFRSKYMPFTYKMMIPYLLLVLVTDIAIGYASYTMLVKSRTVVTQTGIRAALEQTRNNADHRMAEIQRISDQLFGSPIRLTLYTVNPDIGESSGSSDTSPITKSYAFK